MAYMTDRKRAAGLGSAKSGTEHFIFMSMSSVGLVILIPLFVFTFGSALGMSHADAVAYYSRPFPAIVAALTLIVGLLHFKGGVQVLIEDYVHGLAQKIAIAAMICLSYALMAGGLYALVKLAL